MIGKGNSSNSKTEWDRGLSVPGPFKLDHLHLIEPILFQKILNFFTFILGGQFLLPQRANNEKRGFIQLQNWMKQRGFSAWAIQLTHHMIICIQYLVSTSDGAWECRKIASSALLPSPFQCIARLLWPACHRGFHMRHLPLGWDDVNEEGEDSHPVRSQQPPLGTSTCDVWIEWREAGRRHSTGNL